MITGNIAKAYVKISRESAQNLILELCRLEYKNSAYHPSDIFWFIEDGYFYSREYTTELEEGVFIDCNAYTPNGTEEEAVKLFLMLAQMRDDVNEGQWFTSCNPDDSYYYGYADIEKYNQDMNTKHKYGWRRSQPFEVAQAFKEGRIKL